MGVVEFITTQFRDNQFFTAAVLAAPAAMLTYSMRAAPVALWRGFKRAVSVELRFNSDMDEYWRVQEYVMQRLVYSPLSRNFGYRYEHRHYPGSDAPDNQSYVSVGYGNHVGRWRGRPVWIRRTMLESGMTDRFKESLEIIILGRGVRAVQQFLGEVDQYIKAHTRGDKVYLYINNYESWNRVSHLQARPLATVITEGGQAQAALQHIRQFESDKARYIARGLPYHTGILLVGPPGNGKSSLIQALATETGRNLFYLNLASIQEESQIPALMSYSGGWENSILVVEDIDVSGASVDRENEGGITLSTLLNVLDGLLSPMGMVTVATTNAVERLDPALTRPGRFDLVLQLEDLGYAGFTEMAALFEIDPERVAKLKDRYRPTSGAQLRALMTSGAPHALEQYFESLDVPKGNAELLHRARYPR